MGTRHLIAAYQGGVHKIAQYGQWDGYPSGQGFELVKYLKSVDLNVLQYAVSKVKWITPRETAKIEKVKDWPTVYPHLSRDAGAKIFDMVVQAKEPLSLVDSLAFAGDGLFCEWAYVVDFDASSFEVYEGFKKAGTVVEGRFKDFPVENPDYTPVTLVQKYHLRSLPHPENFVDAFEPEDAEEVVDAPAS